MKTFVIAWNWIEDIEDPYIKFVKAESLEKAKEYYWYCIMKFDRSQSIAEIEKEVEVAITFTFAEVPDEIVIYEGE